MNILLLRGYNNYQNRWLKKKNTLGEYKDIVGSENYYEYSDHVNFNINDSVNTNITLNLASEEKPDFMADYVIIHHEGVIKSRWFVLEQIWNRKDQYSLMLKRDLLADYYDVYKSAPMLVEKGYPQPNTFELYNSEGIQYSQIKKEQIYLHNPDIQWVVIYINKNRKGDPFPNKSGVIDSRGNGYPAYVDFNEINYDLANGTSNVTRGECDVGDFIRVTNTYLWIKSSVENWGDSINSSLYIGDEGSNIERYRPVEEGITKDVAYDIITFPYSNNGKNIRFTCTNAQGNRITTIMPGDFALYLAMNIKYTMQDEVYDIQLMPYCPSEGITEYEIDIDGREYNQIDVAAYLAQNMIECFKMSAEFKVEEKFGDGESRVFKGKYNGIANSQFLTNQYYGLYCDSADRVIDKSISYNYAVNNTKEKKVDCECRLIRVCSPTGKSMWDYNFTKNGGNNTNYQIYLTFKPGAPYMHIRPSNFGGIYGELFVNDTRGVIDTSNYSISAVIDSWMQYIQQNNNFQDIFDRKIQSMEYQHGKQLITDIANAFTGTAAGAVAGGIAGGPWGAVAGGIASGIGGIVDVSMNIGLREEQLNLTKDLHNMQLSQIKARPDTLSKLSNVDIDSILGPYVEIYAAPDDEINYLIQLLKYRGYTINRIKNFDEVRSYALSDGIDGVFISGKLIECPLLYDDAHIFSEINNELKMGVRVYL